MPIAGINSIIMGETIAKRYSPKGSITWAIPDKIPVDPEWTIIGNLELPGWSLIGDPLFNVVAHKINKRGIHQYAIGWEHPFAERRADNPGYGFEDGFFLCSAEYIPISYVIGSLVGLEEIKNHPDWKYRIDLKHFEAKPRWRFRGQKTWNTMDTAAEVSVLLDRLTLRQLHNTMFEPNFTVLAIGKYSTQAKELYLQHEEVHIGKLFSAALMLDPASRLVLYGPKFTPLTADIIFFLFNTDPHNIVLINVGAKPRGMTWTKWVEIKKATGIAMVTAESMKDTLFPLKIY